MEMLTIRSSKMELDEEEIYNRERVQVQAEEDKKMKLKLISEEAFPTTIHHSELKKLVKEAIR